MTQPAGSLATDLAGVPLRTPIVLAAGTAGYVDEMADVTNLDLIGAIVTKSITLEPRAGNEPTRIIGTELGMMNAIGLANVGLDRFLAEKLPAAAAAFAQAGGPAIIGSIAGHSIDDYVAVAETFAKQPELSIIEFNVSCPNTADGLVFGDDPVALTELLAAVLPVLGETKMMVKLSPNAPSIIEMARAAVLGGADILSLINTFTALAINVETSLPIIKRGKAGLSGPGIHPIAVRMVHDVFREVAEPADVPIVGYGGVMSWHDAAEFVLVGATAVGMGTALFVDPGIPNQVARGLEQWVSRREASSVRELIGTAKLA